MLIAIEKTSIYQNSIYSRRFTSGKAYRNRVFSPVGKDWEK